MSYPNGSYIVTLSEYKSLTNTSVTTSDTFINSLIPTVQKGIENYLDRKLIKWNWSGWFDYEREIILPEYPINYVQIIGTPCTAITVTESTSPSVYQFYVSSAESTNETVASQLNITNGQTLTTTEFSFDTYTTLGALKTAVETALPTLTLTLNTSSYSDCSSWSTKLLRSGSGSTIYGVAKQDIAYRITGGMNRILSIPNDASLNIATSDFYFDSDIFVAWNAGYAQSNIPQDIKLVASSVIKDMLSIYDSDNSNQSKSIYKSETLGDYSYTLDSMSTINNLIQKYAPILESYKKKSI